MTRADLYFEPEERRRDTALATFDLTLFAGFFGFFAAMIAICQ
jgi:hypothetical protein